MAHICKKRTLGAVGFFCRVLRLEQLFLRLFALKYFFLQLLRPGLQLTIGALQRGIPLLDFGEHGVESIDQPADFVAICFDSPDSVILV